MKKAKSLIIIGSTIRLIIGVVLGAFLTMAYNEFITKYPNEAAMFYHSDAKGEYVAIIGFSILAFAWIFTAIINYICVSMLQKRSAAIITMICGFLSLPIGLLDFLGGKEALNEDSRLAKERYGEESARKRILSNKAIKGVFIGMVIIYFALTALMYVTNVDSGVFGSGGPYSLERLKTDYVRTLFGNNLTGDANALEIAAISLLTLVPFLFGFLYAIFQGCCPSLGLRFKNVKRVIFGLTYLFAFVLYALFLFRLPPLLNKVLAKGIAHSMDVTKIAAYLMPLFYVFAFGLLMNVTSYASGLVLTLICKFRTKPMKQGFSIIGAFVTFGVILGGIPLVEAIVLLMVDLAVVVVKAVIALIGFLVLFALLCAVIGELPNRIVTVHFDDGSSIEINQYKNKGYSTSRYINSNGMTPTNSHDHYLSDEEEKAIDDYFDNH